ncbi:pentatricopeptide repeat (PPR) superfamily protein [Striga asiatica]|uniref:Pentatricopeptide repeat (PPR) superfamily protein n=1 Tax=Striga asiatica TaxID=4170 RepID=A0A5A7RAM0_STRAF|nr:pentatricopeptide repeat (PPR) superfamily protein [Striga asiatica]
MYLSTVPNIASPYITYGKLLSKLAQTKSVNEGLKVHAHLIKSGLFEGDKHRSHLVNLYAKCKFFGHARNLIDESPEPDFVSWCSLVSGYVQNGLGKEAILSFREMRSLDVRCNEYALPSVLKACSETNNFTFGKQVHGLVLVTGFGSDVGEECGLLEYFAFVLRSGRFFSEAMGLFGEMVCGGVRPDEYCLSTVLNAAAGIGDIDQGKKVHGYLIKLGYEGDQFSLNALVDMYTKVGDFKDAIDVFGNIPEPDIVSWNALISGCVLHGYYDQALASLERMQRSGVNPNVFTLPSALKACAALADRRLGKQLHARLIKMEIMMDPFVFVGLIDMYCKCQLMKHALMVYRLMPEKNLVAMNAMIAGHTLNGENWEALTLFTAMYNQGMEFNQATLLAALNTVASLEALIVSKQIHGLIVKSGYQADSFILNSLVDVYGKCKQVHDAGRIFEECPVWDLPSYTSLMTTYAQCGQGEEALKLYLKVLDRGLAPDSFICSSLLNACANLSAYEQGKQIHVHVLKLGFMSDSFAGNSLVNMYAKCGSIEEAGRAFDEVLEKSVISWSAMIGGLAQHGHGKQALHLFDDMLKDGVSPNHVTLVSVLSACNHAGLVEEAQLYFDTMKERFGIDRTQEHYACMIDVLGRAGKLDRAMNLVNGMPFEANGAIWGALLGAAKTHKNVELGEHAANMLQTLEPEKSGTHVLLANIYASAGLWDNVAKARRLMKDSNVKKEPGMSWMEVKDNIHTFIVRDKSHPRSEEIYAKLEELGRKMEKDGYVPMIETDLHHVEKKEKELLLSFHSEKLAVAFGLIVTPPRAPIRVKKNLRICVDCHTVFKFAIVSNIPTYLNKHPYDVEDAVPKSSENIIIELNVDENPKIGYTVIKLDINQFFEDDDEARFDSSVEEIIGQQANGEEENRDIEGVLQGHIISSGQEIFNEFDDRTGEAGETSQGEFH